MQNLWDQRLDESQKSFGRFVQYRDMGTERSLRKLASDLGLSLSTIAEISKRHAWQERALAFDAYIDQASQFSQLTHLKAMKRRQIDLALKAQELAQKGLEMLMRNIEEKGINNLRPEGLSRLLDIGCRLERLNRDQPEQTMEVAQARNYDNLSIEEMNVMRTLMLKAQGQQ